MTATKPQSTTEETLEPCSCICHVLIDHCQRCSGQSCRPASAVPVVDELKLTIEEVIRQFRASQTHKPTYCCPEDESVYDRILTRMLVEKLAAAATAAPVQPTNPDLLSAFKELIKWHHMAAKHGGSAEECEWAVCVAYRKIAENCSEHKQPLPTHYLCIAPDEQPKVINSLRGYGTDVDRELAQLHLNLCLRCKELANAAPVERSDEVVDEVQHRMDQVVEAAVEWHQAGREGAEWFEAAEKLGAAIDSLLELRGEPVRTQ